jgi:hypothetical protein
MFCGLTERAAKDRHARLHPVHIEPADKQVAKMQPQPREHHRPRRRPNHTSRRGECVERSDLVPRHIGNTKSAKPPNNPIELRISEAIDVTDHDQTFCLATGFGRRSQLGSARRRPAGQVNIDDGHGMPFNRYR